MYFVVIIGSVRYSRDDVIVKQYHKDQLKLLTLWRRNIYTQQTYFACRSCYRLDICCLLFSQGILVCSSDSTSVQWDMSYYSSSGLLQFHWDWEVPPGFPHPLPHLYSHCPLYLCKCFSNLSFIAQTITVLYTIDCFVHRLTISRNTGACWAFSVIYFPTKLTNKPTTV